MQTFSAFPGTPCACCSWKSVQQSNYYLDILPTVMAGVAIVMFSLIIALKHAIFIAFTLRKLQLLAQFAAVSSSCRSNADYYPLKQSALDLQITYKMLIRDNPIRANFHLYEKIIKYHFDDFVEMTI